MSHAALRPRAAALIAALWLLAPGARGADTVQAVFSDYSPLSSNLELARRLLTPLTAAQVPQRLASSAASLAEQPLDLSAERFLVYVPGAAPPQGYGLLVFVPPWPDARLPKGWGTVLDRYHMIFVSAAGSGNEASDLGRREPLALLAEHNISARYPVDARQIYVGGFSGGARIAMRLALAYPDVFRGALLNAGSDPVGEGEVAVPARELLMRFQESSRLVYVTGDADQPRLAMQAASIRSLRAWCVFDLHEQTPSLLGRGTVGHEVASAAALSQALDTLLQRARPDPARLDACRAGLEHELASRFQQLEALNAAGQLEAARAALRAIDRHFGGLAAPRSVELARRLGAADAGAAPAPASPTR
jgi:pimeloyl-ACP methyl ester carboxylesterase